jgi:hypothetical protein
MDNAANLQNLQKKRSNAAKPVFQVISARNGRKWCEFGARPKVR